MKTKQMKVSEFSKEGEELLADGICEVSGKDLAMVEATKFELSVEVADNNTIGTGPRYIGPDYTPTAKQANDLIKLVLSEVKKWG